MTGKRMRNYLFAAAAGAAFFMSFAPAASPRVTVPGCLPRAEMGRLLAEEYNERLRGQGLNSNGRLIEIYVNPVGDSWSLTETDPSGQSCLRAAGQYWQMERDAGPEAGGQPAGLPGDAPAFVGPRP